MPANWSTCLSVELDHIIPDELHLLLRLVRVMDILLRNVINSSIEYDSNSTCKHSDDVLKGLMLMKLSRISNDCGMRFTLIKRRVKQNGQL